MSYVGDPYEYDIFFSYAYAEKQSDTELLKAWSQRVADKISKLLALGFNAEAGKRVFEPFLDQRVIPTAAPLTKTLREGAEGSAALLVMLSPFYKEQPWCRDELNWYLERAKSDGRNYEQTILIAIMPTSPDKVPEPFLDENSNPFTYRAFHDGFLPYGMARPDDPKLDEAIAETVQEAALKLKSYRDIRRARQTQTAVPAVPDTPTLYLSAASGQGQAWAAARATLIAAGATVFPTRFPTATGDALDQTVRSDRLAALEACDGFVVLRTAYDAASDRELLGAMNDVGWLVQNRGKVLPWAVVDDLPAGMAEEPDDSAMPNVPRLSARPIDWPSALFARLREAAQAKALV